MIAYTNVNGLLSAQVELNDNLREYALDVMRIIETKLSDNIEVNDSGERKYNVWLRNRNEKQGGGVMVLVRKDLLAYETNCDYELAKVIKVEVVCREGGKQNFAVVYVPPKTNSWGLWNTRLN